MQVGQLVSMIDKREKRIFPSQPITNPKDAKPNHTNSAHVNLIYTLRSGRQVDNKVVMPDQSTTSPSESDLSSSLLDKSKEIESEPNANESMYNPRAPFQVDSKNNLLRWRKSWRSSSKSKSTSPS